jgi:hypothetical protein
MPDEFVTGIAKDCFNLCVRQVYLALCIDHNHGIRCSLHHQAERLFRLFAPGDVKRHAAHTDGLAAVKLDAATPSDPTRGGR